MGGELKMHLEDAARLSYLHRKEMETNANGD